MTHRHPRAFVGWAAAAALVGALLAAQRAPAASLGSAPEFRLPLLTGGTISLADLKNRPVILLFWAPW